MEISGENTRRFSLRVTFHSAMPTAQVHAWRALAVHRISEIISPSSLVFWRRRQTPIRRMRFSRDVRKTIKKKSRRLLLYTVWGGKLPANKLEENGKLSTFHNSKNSQWAQFVWYLVHEFSFMFEEDQNYIYIIPNWEEFVKKILETFPRDLFSPVKRLENKLLEIAHSAVTSQFEANSNTISPIRYICPHFQGPSRNVPDHWEFPGRLKSWPS